MTRGLIRALLFSLSTASVAFASAPPGVIEMEKTTEDVGTRDVTSPVGVTIQWTNVTGTHHTITHDRCGRGRPCP